MGRGSKENLDCVVKSAINIGRTPVWSLQSHSASAPPPEGSLDAGRAIGHGRGRRGQSGATGEGGLVAAEAPGPSTKKTSGASEQACLLCINACTSIFRVIPLAKASEELKTSLRRREGIAASTLRHPTEHLKAFRGGGNSFLSQMQTSRKASRGSWKT